MKKKRVEKERDKTINKRGKGERRLESTALSVKFAEKGSPNL